MNSIEKEFFDKVASSTLAQCFITVDGQPLCRNSVFYIKGDVDWDDDYQHLLGTDGMPDGTPALYKMNLKERLALGTDGSAVSLRGRALDLSQPVVRQTADNGEGYNYVDGKRLARLIWETWYGGIPDGLEVDHWNRVRNDDRLVNLHLVTHSQNTKNRRPKAYSSWLATDRALLIPSAGDPVLVHPSAAYEVVRDHNTWKLLHGQRVTANGWGAIINPTVDDVVGYFKAYANLDRPGLLDKCLALLQV